MFLKLFLFVLNGIFCFADLPLLHPADSIELYSSLQFCPNSSFVIKEMELEFANCLSKNVPPHPGIVIHGWLFRLAYLYGRACSDYKEEYIRCWDSVIQKSKECNSKEHDKGSPVIFLTLLETVCKDDLAYTFTSNFKAALQTSTIGNYDKSKVFKNHWTHTCTNLDSMNSGTKCRKYSDISNCLERIIYKGNPMGTFLKDIYEETGEMLGCGKNKMRTDSRENSKRRGSINKGN